MDPKQTEPTNAEPVIADAEMKVPEEAMRVSHVGGDQATLPIVLGVIIVLLVLVLAGLYLWGTTLQGTPMPEEAAEVMRPTPEENNEPESETADAQVQALETMSTSNSLEAIEADVESTNLDAIDAELGAIEAEFDAALEEMP